MNSNAEEKEFSYDISFSTNVFLPPNIDSNLAINFIKNIEKEIEIEIEMVFIIL